MRHMKKALSALLALLMAFSLFACGTSGSAPPSPGEAGAAQPETGAEASASEAPKASNIGFYDPNFDYSKNPRYKVVYMMNATGVLFDMFDRSFAEWAKKANVEYSSFNANGDTDYFLTSIETFASQGVNGFLMDPDNIFPRIDELMRELGLPWMSCMAEPVDENGNRLHPVAGFDNYQFGVDMATWCIEYLKKTWPDAKPSEVGMLSMDISISPQIHQRTEGAKDVFLKEFPGNDANFVHADGVSIGLYNAEGGYNLAAASFAGRPDIKYWLICACYDDYADGAARAAEASGIDERCVATTCGGSGLINHWDAGEESCWKSAVYCAQTLFAEPLFFALYAFMSGQATPETIWPEWIDKSHGQKYAYLNLPTFIITKDTYKEYMEWVDTYTGINMSPYDSEYKGTQFPVRTTPPASYAG